MASALLMLEISKSTAKRLSSFVSYASFGRDQKGIATLASGQEPSRTPSWSATVRLLISNYTGIILAIAGEYSLGQQRDPNEAAIGQSILRVQDRFSVR